MPTASSTRSSAEASSPAKFPVLVLVLTLIAGIVIGLACLVGGYGLLIKTGRIHPVPWLRPAEKGSPASTGSSIVSLDPILVNLADSGGHGYLRLGLALQIENTPGMTPSTDAAQPLTLPREHAIPVRDTVLAVLGQQTSGALLEPEGKDRLKQELLTALAQHNPDLKLRGLYFSDFLVQP